MTNNAAFLKNLRQATEVIVPHCKSVTPRELHTHSMPREILEPCEIDSLLTFQK